VGGNVWDSLAGLLKIMKLRGVGADNVKEVQEIVECLFTNIVKPARSKRDNQQAETHVNHLLFQLVDNNVGRGLFSGSSPRIGEEGNQ